ncbi:UNVERIFIED_CONTAM: Protease HtpX2 [Sesamum radiatum]|uniref:Protease HtpX2 n=1 Tax=Sesamum radiatum TaxID=300843 RepID=A0AAW2P801_SESRA
MAAIPLPSVNCPEKLSRISFYFSATNKPLISFPGGFKLKPLKSKPRSKGFVCRAASSVAIRDLDADDFRHPLDRQNTLILRAIPGLNEIGKALLGTVTEQVMLLENIGTSVLVSENQLPELHELLVEAARILNIEAPDLYLRQSPVPNAYTLAISGKKPFVVVHTSLVELLSRKELQAVLAHELGHLKCDHGVWLTFANILTLGAYSLPGLGSLIAQRLEEQLFRWLRAAELTCDRAALLVARDPKVVISVLMKLAGGCPSMADKLNVDAFLDQARSYEKAASSPVGWYIRNAQTSQLSHPLPVLRAREIDEWSRSKEYQSLLKRVKTPKTWVLLVPRTIHNQTGLSTMAKASQSTQFSQHPHVTQLCLETAARIASVYAEISPGISLLVNLSLNKTEYKMTPSGSYPSAIIPSNNLIASSAVCSRSFRA